jgi:hypothetical protein
MYSSDHRNVSSITINGHTIDLHSQNWLALAVALTPVQMWCMTVLDQGFDLLMELCKAGVWKYSGNQVEQYQGLLSPIVGKHVGICMGFLMQKHAGLGFSL